MGLFSAISDAFNSTIGKVVNDAFKPFGSVLHSMGLDSVLGPACAMLSKIPGVGSTVGGALAVVPHLMQGKFGLGDALMLGSMVAPPPANMFLGMAGLGKVTEAVVGVAGAIDPNSAGGKNLLSFAQNYLKNADV